MKKIFTLFWASIGMLAVQAQSPTVTLSPSNACVGETVTATLVAPEFELASTAVGTNQQNGVMFDLVGVEGAIIKGFLVNVDQANTDFEIYYRTGSYMGFEDSQTGWTLLGSSSGIAMGTDMNTGIELDVPILPGQTLAFYITTTDPLNEFIRYANGTAEGTSLGGNLYINIFSGVGKAYPFSDTFTPRDFIGKVLYEPILANITWLNNASTTETAEYTATRSTGIVATTTYGGDTHRGDAIMTVREVEVEATATPAVLGWDESSTISANVVRSTGIGTMFTAGNNHNGAMFDVSAMNSVTINGFSVYPAYGTGTGDVEVFYKTGTFVGSETNSGAWTSIGTATGLVEEEDSYVALTSPLTVAPGQTMAFYITRTDGGFLYYTNTLSIGDVVNSDGYLSVKSGSGVSYPFNNTYANRMLNTVVHYEVENPAGLTYSWSPGGAISGSIVVTPNADVTYMVLVTDGSCQAENAVSVSMALAVAEAAAESIKVYPNPANDQLTIRAENPLNVQNIVMMDASGKVVFQNAPNGQFTNLTVPVNHLASGLYLIQLNVDGKLTTRKVSVQ